jgi:hypothetical protein
MELKDMILCIVYQTKDGLFPLKIVEEIARQYGTVTTTKQVLHIVEKNPKLFVEKGGKIRSPAEYSI